MRWRRASGEVAAVAWLGLIAGAIAGCAGPGPRLFPPAALDELSIGAGCVERRYDTNGDGRPDRAERLGASGRVETLCYDADQDGSYEEQVELSAIPAAERRDVILLLDSVPHGLVEDAWSRGRLRLFGRPARVVSPFPVMTDVAYSDLLGTTPVPAAESEYFDGDRLRNGYAVYLRHGNTPWQRFVTYRLSSAAHPLAYTRSYDWYLHELGRIERGLEDSEGRFVGYSVGTSALGAQNGRNGHVAGLVELDRFCQELMFRAHGRLRITLVSDHGHNLIKSRRVPLSEMLARFGYRVGERLRSENDVVVAEFGIVTYASIWTPRPADVARDAVAIEGIELAAYRDADGDVVVIDRAGRARIRRRELETRDADGANEAARSAFSYDCERGDPLRLRAVWDDLAARGQVDAEGFVDDRTLCDATLETDFPDAVRRMWRAFHGLMEHTPDVMLSVQDGWHCGSALMTRVLPLSAAHGSLRGSSTFAFAATTAGELPATVRMDELGGRLRALGVDMPDARGDRRD
ncbi:MAG: hypothetical protein CHACPFDD_02707 [Phycisphaerae bacterium]|nr:hypothetical protein [Phycisphaerae bacterium]